ncbi:MAG TPA: hypothetical protein VMR41_02620 [Patescibacteria group bacterium]|nr:hypothetical protein [Patescibacteria group bacterium]
MRTLADQERRAIRNGEHFRVGVIHQLQLLLGSIELAVDEIPKLGMSISNGSQMMVRVTCHIPEPPGVWGGLHLVVNAPDDTELSMFIKDILYGVVFRQENTGVVKSWDTLMYDGEGLSIKHILPHDHLILKIT